MKKSKYRGDKYVTLSNASLFIGNSFAKATLEPISTSVLSGGAGNGGLRNLSPLARANLSLPLNTSNLLGKTLGNTTVLGSPTKKIDSMMKFGDGYAR
jgi:hypothetical protein